MRIDSTRGKVIAVGSGVGDGWGSGVLVGDGNTAGSGEGDGKIRVGDAGVISP
jgi:hypothetical protein